MPAQDRALPKDATLMQFPFDASETLACFAAGVARP